ncbi:MAG: hypothetical protein HRT94_04650 [Alphaproteobacteria bacterium]|nr:hypothetical protein [Alphaproteobacteria bacterium]
MRKLNELERIILGFIWSLKPSDLSSLYAAIQEMDKNEDVQISSVLDTAAYVFYSNMREFNIVEEVALDISKFSPDLQKTMERHTSFRIKKKYIPFLSDAVTIIQKSADLSPHYECILTSESMGMLAFYLNEGIDGAKDKIDLALEHGENGRTY